MKVVGWIMLVVEAVQWSKIADVWAEVFDQWIVEG